MKCKWMLMLGLMVCACGHEKMEKEQELHNVYVVSPSDYTPSQERTFAGVVEEKGEIGVGFKTAGQLKTICVKEGQAIRPGQLLAVLDDSDYKLGVEALKIQYDQVKDEVERAKRLFEKKSMSVNDYEKAAAGLRQLGVQLQVNKNKLAYTRLTSPCAGVVESVNFSVGEMVDAGTSVFTVLDMSQKSVTVDIPASLYMQRESIEAITCTSNHNPGETYPMTMLSIVPKADSNQLYRMKLGFRGGASGITPGMNVEVRIEFNSNGEEKMKIPSSALFRKGEEAYVWTVNADSTVTMSKVEINPLYTGSEVEILSGLSPDAKVVRAGVRMLHEGEKIRIIGKPSKTNVGGML